MHDRQYDPRYGAGRDLFESALPALPAEAPQRDPWISYGNPPRMRPNPRTGQGLFEPVAKVVASSGDERRPVKHHEKGVTIPTLRPTVEQFLRHARLYGEEGVAAAASLELTSPELATLRVRLIAQAGAKSKRGGQGKGGRPSKRRSPQETLWAAQALLADGVLVGAVASQLGVGKRYLRRLLQSSAVPDPVGGR